MSRNIFMVPVRSDGLYVASMALAEALRRQGCTAEIFNPMIVSECASTTALHYGVPALESAFKIGWGRKNEVFGAIAENFKDFCHDHPADVYIVEGVVTPLFPQDEVNAQIADTLQCRDLVVVKPGGCIRSKAFRDTVLSHFGSDAKQRVLGDIVFNNDAQMMRGKFRRKILFAGEPVGKGHACATRPVEEGIMRDEDGIRQVAVIGYDSRNYAQRAREIASFIFGSLDQGDENAKAISISLSKDGDDAAVSSSEQVHVFSEPPESCDGIVVLCNGQRRNVNGASAVISAQGSVLDVVQALQDAPAVFGEGDEEKASNARQYADRFHNLFISELAQQSTGQAAKA